MTIETAKSSLQMTVPEDYKVYEYRYVVGVVYALAAIQNVLMWLIFTPIQLQLTNIYDVSLLTVNFATILISNVSYIPANFVASYLIDTYGLRFGTIVGAILTTIGLWTRCLCKEGFLYIFIGQCFAGVAQPFFYSTPQKISNVWFGMKERTLATTIIAASLNIGSALGAFLPQFFINLKETDPDVLLDQIKNMMILTAIAGSFFLVVTIRFFREKPPSPPSKGAAAQKHNYLDSLKTLIKNKNAMIFLISSSAVSGSVITFTSAIQAVTDPYGITSDQIGNILFISILIGFVSAGASGAYVDKTKKYKKPVMFFSASSLVLLMINYFCVITKNVYIFGAGFCFYTFLISPVMPLSMETMVEYSFPVAEATSGGLWFMFNQLLSTLESLGVDAIFSKAPTKQEGRIAFIIMVVYQVAAVFLMIFAKEDLQRSKFEKDGLLSHPEQETDKSQVYAQSTSL